MSIVLDPNAGLSAEELNEFESTGFLNLGRILSDEDLSTFTSLFDQDRKKYPYMWHAYGYRQIANYEALVSSPRFDELIRHPLIYPKVVSLMGGPVCFGEIGLRFMGPYDGPVHQAWHRDRGYRFDHPLRIDYLQLMVYLTDVNETTHCFSISPERKDTEPCKTADTQLETNGSMHLLGPAGTCALFNVALFHTATTRPTKAERKTVQIYYGHRDRPPLANDSGIPATFSLSSDVETRRFYGNLNERSRLFMRAYGTKLPPTE